MPTESELTRLFAELHERYSVPEPGPGEFSVQQFAEAQGLTYATAKRIVERAEKDNAVKLVGDRLVDGRRAACYMALSRPTPAD